MSCLSARVMVVGVVVVVVVVVAVAVVVVVVVVEITVVAALSVAIVVAATAQRKVWRCSSAASLTSILDKGGWLTTRPGRFMFGKTRYPMYRRLGGPHGRSGRTSP